MVNVILERCSSGLKLHLCRERDLINICFLLFFFVKDLNICFSFLINNICFSFPFIYLFIFTQLLFLYFNYLVYFLNMLPMFCITFAYIEMSVCFLYFFNSSGNGWDYGEESGMILGKKHFTWGLVITKADPKGSDSTISWRLPLIMLPLILK